MTSAQALLTCALFLATLTSCVIGDEIIVTKTTRTERSSDTSREKEAIKSKLEGTEARVRDLLADLETFSSTASKAKAEIHSSLLETWKNVERLAMDRCGTELESIRISQRKAEAKAAELQDEARIAAQEMESFKLSLNRASNQEAQFKNELSTERTRRESIEAEVFELRDKLHWASASANETRSYDLVAERLEALLLVVTERSQMLQRAMQLVTDHHDGFEDWRSELATLGSLVRDANQGFARGSDVHSAASEALQRQVSDLQRRLKDSEKARSDAVAERNSARISFDKLRSSSKQTTTVSGDRIIYHTRDGYGVVGVISACVTTLLCGALLLLFCGWGPSAGAGGAGGTVGGGGGGGGQSPQYESVRKANGYTPDKPSSGLRHAQTSPVTFVAGPGSGTRQSTPRRY